MNKQKYEIKRIKPPQMSDNECYLRLGVPDGVQTDGSHAETCGVMQDPYGPQNPHNPLTKKGKKIMAAMKSEYGEEKGERVFYASKNKGRIKGVEGK